MPGRVVLVPGDVLLSEVDGRGGEALAHMQQRAMSGPGRRDEVTRVDHVDPASWLGLCDRYRFSVPRVPNYPTIRLA